MKTVLLEPGDDRWMEVLRSIPHEFYHLPGYVELEATRMGGKPIAVFVDGDDGSLLVPMVLREVRGVGEAPGDLGVLDAVSPYGYPGPLVKSESGDTRRLVGRAVASALPVLAEVGVISAFVRLNPISNRPGDFLDTGSIVEHGPTVWIDLTLSEEELHRALRSRFRSYLGAASRSGLVARFDESWDHLESFVRLYHNTMDRVDAASWYYFDQAYFEQLRSTLGNDLKLCVVEHDEELVAAGLFADSDGIVQYLFSGTDVTSGHPHATKLMMVHVRDWAKRMGFSVFHLGGGLGGGDDSLSRFKKGFSKLTRPFCSWRLVIDPQAYGKVTRIWEKESGQEADGVDGFFPAYRKPLTKSESR